MKVAGYLLMVIMVVKVVAVNVEASMNDEPGVKALVGRFDWPEQTDVKD